MNLIETEIQLFNLHAKFLAMEEIDSPWVDEFGIELSEF